MGRMSLTKIQGDSLLQPTGQIPWPVLVFINRFIGGTAMLIHLYVLPAATFFFFLVTAELSSYQRPKVFTTWTIREKVCQLLL